MQRLHHKLSTKNIRFFTRSIFYRPLQRRAIASAGLNAVAAVGAIVPGGAAPAAGVQIERAGLLCGGGGLGVCFC